MAWRGQRKMGDERARAVRRVILVMLAVVVVNAIASAVALRLERKVYRSVTQISVAATPPSTVALNASQLKLPAQELVTLAVNRLHATADAQVSQIDPSASGPRRS